MSIATNINRLMAQQDISAQQLSELSGVSLVNLKKYIAGKIIPAEKPLTAISRALSVSPEVLTAKAKGKTRGKLRPQDAAELLDMDVQTVRIRLQRGTLPIGTAIKTGNRYDYDIDAARLRDYAESLAAVRKELQ